ncbi:MAG: NAD-dependent epimerase/dehydratase family protein [bacterium]
MNQSYHQRFGDEQPLFEKIEMKKAYITGATGFIGGRLVRLLVEKQMEVTCLVRSPEKIEHLKPLGIKVVTGDITDEERVAETIQGHDLVFHIAAWYEIGVRSGKESAMRLTNVTGTKNVLQTAWKSGAKRIVYCSTVAALGSSGPPDRIGDENHPHDGRFQSLYAKTKWEAHQTVKGLIKEGAPIVMVLPGAVYGPGDTSLITRQMRLIVNEKVPAMPKAPGIYCYTHVDDVVAGIWLAAEEGRVSEQYVLAGPALTMVEFHHVVARQAGVKPPALRIPSGVLRALAWIHDNVPGGKIVSGGMPMSREAIAMTTQANWAFSSQKAEKELGWKARSFEEGLAETLEWIRKQVVPA